MECPPGPCSEDIWLLVFMALYGIPTLASSFSVSFDPLSAPAVLVFLTYLVWTFTFSMFQRAIPGICQQCLLKPPPGCFVLYHEK